MLGHMLCMQQVPDSILGISTNQGPQLERVIEDLNLRSRILLVGVDNTDPNGTVLCFRTIQLYMVSVHKELIPCLALPVYFSRQGNSESGYRVTFPIEMNDM